MKPEEHNIAQLLKRSMPSEQEVEAAGKLVLEELRSMRVEHSVVPDSFVSRPRSRFLLAVAAAVISVSVVAILVMRNMNSRQWVRATDPEGMILTLRDGSQVEMRSQSVLRVDEASDGLRVRLNEGNIIVTAAKQKAGHLYVETKDAMVSVVGTVFAVSVEQAGSRVGVLEGAVNVQQATAFKQLLPGQQLATNPNMESMPVEQQVRWSRKAAALLALLQQITAAPAQQPTLPAASATPQKGPERPEAFEVVSVRPNDVSIERVGRGGALPSGYGCGGSFLQLDPRHFAITTTVLNLVAIAYGKGCVHLAKHDLIGGGPPWTKSEQFTIQAVIPEDSPNYTRAELLHGRAPQLQTMLRTLLADRFQLSLRHDSKEQPVYALTVVKSGSKLTPFNEANCDAPRQPQMPSCGEGIFFVNQKSHFEVIANGTTLDGFADLLTGFFDRPVVNRTGIAGTFFLRLDSAMEFTMFCREPPCTDQMLGTPSDNPPLIFDAIQQQLGLKLESIKAPVEKLIIDQVERPSEN